MLDPFKRAKKKTKKARRKRGPVVGLVACCGPKLKHPAQARILYTSPLFKKSVAYLEHLGVDQWAILSAKYGLVKPGRVIEPYNKTLARMSPRERKLWAKTTAAQLVKAWPPGTTFVVLAGRHYFKAVEGLEDFGYTIKDPLKGMGIGDRLHWLGEAVS